jgi:RimJ/RimL family protein N-acetyltransferase
MFTFREPTLDDVDWITEACQDSEILRWTVVPRPYTKDHARSFVADRAGELCAWAIIDSRNERGAGMLGVHHVTDGVASIGYWIALWARRGWFKQPKRSTFTSSPASVPKTMTVVRLHREDRTRPSMV